MSKTFKSYKFLFRKNSIKSRRHTNKAAYADRNKSKQTQKDKPKASIGDEENTTSPDVAQMIIANRISTKGLYISTALFIITLFALAGSFYSTFLTRRALQDSRTNAIEESVRNRAIDQRSQDALDLSREQFEEGKKYNDSTITISNQSLQAQINSIKETQRQFEINNKPFLQCSDFTVVQFEAGKPIKIAFKLANIGNAPARVFRKRLGAKIEKEIELHPEVYISKEKDDEAVSLTYLTSQYATIELFTRNLPVTKEDYEAAINKTKLFCFYGEIEYVNETNQKNRILRFSAILLSPNGKEYKLVYLKNFDVPKSEHLKPLK